MTKIKKKYYLRYVKDCSPKLKEFNTKEALYKFTAEFAAETMYDNPDNFIEFAFEGNVFLKGDNYRVEKQ